MASVGTGMASVGTGMASVGTGMASVGTGMASVGTGEFSVLFQNMSTYFGIRHKFNPFVNFTGNKTIVGIQSKTDCPL